MALSVLIAEQVAEVCYLHEALYWLALSRFPIASYTETGDDWRHYDKIIDGIDPPYTLDTVSRDECLMAGLPANPAWEAEQTFTLHRHPEVLKRWIARESDEQRRSSFQNDLEESTAYHQKLVNWNSMFESFLDLHAARLFVALRQGDIVASGKRISNRSLVQLLRQAAEDESRREQFGHDLVGANAPKRRVRAPDWYCVDWEPIPKEFWTSKSIDWKHCCAQGDGGGYAFVMVETAQLFEAFPVPVGRPIKRVSQVGSGYVLLDDEGKTVNPSVISRGRPAYDWSEFNVEMAKRARDKTFPEKQETLIAEMQAWCATRWGHEVGRSTLLQKIKPYYDSLVRSSES